MSKVRTLGMCSMGRRRLGCRISHREPPTAFPNHAGMGQTNLLGRYPFHMHLNREAGANSYLEDSVIRRSFFRCASIHGTNNTRLSRNIAFDVIGHCYYLEDGVEENNLIEYNLAAHVSDPRPAMVGWTMSAGCCGMVACSGRCAESAFAPACPSMLRTPIVVAGSLSLPGRPIEIELSSPLRCHRDRPIPR